MKKFIIEASIPGVRFVGEKGNLENVSKNCVILIIKTILEFLGVEKIAFVGKVLKTLKTRGDYLFEIFQNFQLF